MKDNNNTTNNTRNNPRNNNTSNVTFVEHISNGIRRNSTIPQAIEGELRIVNGDVEGSIAVYCSNAAYRDKLFKEAELETSKAIGTKEVATKSNEATVALNELEAKYASSSFKEKLEGDFYNKKLSLEAKADKGEDMLADTLVGLQLLKKFKAFTYSVREYVVTIDGGSLHRESIYALLTKMHVSEAVAADIEHMISDCVCLDVCTIKAYEKRVRIIAGNLDGVIMRYDSSEASTTTSKFIHDVLEANSPRA